MRGARPVSWPTDREPLRHTREVPESRRRRLKSYQFREYGARLEEVDAPEPRPSGSEVLLRVTACGVCHSAASASEAATDNNLPEQQLCLACHNGETAPAIDASRLADRTPAERFFEFNHKQHLEMGNPAEKIAEAIDAPVQNVRVVITECPEDRWFVAGQSIAARDRTPG